MRIPVLAIFGFNLLVSNLCLMTLAYAEPVRAADMHAMHESMDHGEHDEQAEDGDCGDRHCVSEGVADRIALLSMPLMVGDASVGTFGTVFPPPTTGRPTALRTHAPPGDPVETIVLRC